jgi:adenosylcobinamide-GDP ribazoletransferase
MTRSRAIVNARYAHAVRPLALALSFLTRVPVRTGEVGAHEPAAALSCFPVVGALIGGVLWLVQLALAPHLGPWLTAFALVAASALITGALHLDGVADLADALGGGRGDRNRMLDIMRDPRIGAHGAAGLVLVLAGKLLASAELILRGDTLASAWPIVLAPLWARLVCVVAIKAFPYARASGLGLSFHMHAKSHHVLLAALPCLVVIALLLNENAPPILLGGALSFSATVVLLLALRVHRLLGGITGDVHGASIELCELLVLVAACWK